MVIEVGFVFRYNQQKCSEVSANSWRECENKLKISYLRGSSGAPDNKNVYENIDAALGDRDFIETKLEETSQDDGDLFESQIDLEFNSAVSSQLNTAAKIYDGGIYLAFTDHGSCTVIHSIKVFYYFCPRTVSNFAIYPKTTSSGSSRKVSGQCSSGASSEENKLPKALCNAAGVWDHLKSSNDKCLCDAGYESENDDRIKCARELFYISNFSLNLTAPFCPVQKCNEVFTRSL